MSDENSLIQTEDEKQISLPLESVEEKHCKPCMPFIWNLHSSCGMVLHRTLRVKGPSGNHWSCLVFGLVSVSSPLSFLLCRLSILSLSFCPVHWPACFSENFFQALKLWKPSCICFLYWEERGWIDGEEKRTLGRGRGDGHKKRGGGGRKREKRQREMGGGGGDRVCLFVGWLLNIPATCVCISGTDLLRQFYVLPHWDRSCRSNCPSHPVTVYWHRADQSQRWYYIARRLAG